MVQDEGKVIGIQARVYLRVGQPLRTRPFGLLRQAVAFVSPNFPRRLSVPRSIVCPPFLELLDGFVFGAIRGDVGPLGSVSVQQRVKHRGVGAAQSR